MASFIDPQNGDAASAESIAQVVEDFQGLRNIPLSLTGINDATNYALTIRNAGTGGRGLQVLSSAAAVLLTVQDSGVTLATPTLTSPHMTSPVVDSGGLTVTLGGITVTGNSTITGNTILTGSLAITTQVGFYGQVPQVKQTITGAKGGNAALTSLLAGLASLGLVTDSTT
jgi:hypothetical protein